MYKLFIMSETAPSLPDELSQAHHLVAQLSQSVTALRTSLEHKDALIEKLLHELMRLKRHRYGQRSERLADALQGELFAALEALQLTEAGRAKPPASTSSTGPKGKPKRKRPPAHLPRERREYTLEGEACRCTRCGDSLNHIGEESSEQLEYVPASFFVIEHVRHKYACAHCDGEVRIAPKPAQPIDKGLPGPGLLAQVLTSKYCDHVPLTRQQRIFKREAVPIPVSTLVGWVKHSTNDLKALVETLRGYQLRSAKLHTDDTPVPVLTKDRQQTKKGRLWVYISAGEHRCTVFDYTPTRSRDGPLRYLEGFSGYLQADAYAGYDVLYATGKVVEVGCWAHARRKLFEAQSSDEHNATEALGFIRALYGVEDEAGETPCDDEASRAALRLRLRQDKSKPILGRFRTWLDDTARVVLPKSPMGKAIQYALNQWAALCRYTEDPSLAIDNNAAEREMKHVAVGRKNYLFAGSDAGGERAAIVYSLVATCKQYGIDPYEYLRDVLARLPITPRHDLETLTPWNWTPPQS